MLKISVCFKSPNKFLSNDFVTSIGNPIIDPETSTIKIYSLGGIFSVITFFGGSIISEKKFSSFPSYNNNPGSISESLIV